jgi:hypothetical protein
VARGLSAYAVETARQEWEEGHRRFQEEASDPRRRLRLLDQLETVTGELRRRLGTTFTLSELVATYPGIEDWAREAVEDYGGPGWARDVTLVADEAFHLYARGATDYRP